MRALWEQLNQQKWLKARADDRDYILEAFNDISMEDAQDQEEEEEEEEAEEEVYSDDENQSEHYDSDEEQDDVATGPQDGSQNSQLAVGYKHDRSFVVRGSKIGVFKHTPKNGLEFATSINKIATPKGKLFQPKKVFQAPNNRAWYSYTNKLKVMLHGEDSSLILQDGDNPHSLYRMDLEYGKVVDEWKVHDHIAVNSFVPENVSTSSPCRVSR